MILLSVCLDIFGADVNEFYRYWLQICLPRLKFNGIRLHLFCSNGLPWHSDKKKTQPALAIQETGLGHRGKGIRPCCKKCHRRTTRGAARFPWRRATLPDVLCVLWSEDRAIFTGKHEPHCARIFRIGEHPRPNCQPHVVATATDNVLTKWRPVSKTKREMETNRSREVLRSQCTWYEGGNHDKQVHGCRRRAESSTWRTVWVTESMG